MRYLSVLFPQMTNILDYENDQLVSDFMLQQECSESFARDVFLELKKFLCIASKSNSKLALTPSPLVDEMRHIFLENADIYQEFCKKYIGTMIGHNEIRVPIGHYRETYTILSTTFGSINPKIWPQFSWAMSPCSCVIETKKTKN